MIAEAARAVSGTCFGLSPNSWYAGEKIIGGPHQHYGVFLTTAVERTLNKHPTVQTALRASAMTIAELFQQILADLQTLTGDMTADSLSSIAATLKNGSLLTGKLTSVAVTLDAGSVWSVTGNSALTSLTDSAGISGASIANIKGNG